MRNERNGQTVKVRPLPHVIERWRQLGYAVDTDSAGHSPYDEARANGWGAPNLWERNAPLNVDKTQPGRRRQRRRAAKGGRA